LSEVECYTCNKIGVHYLSYLNYDTDINWIGMYCNSCFVKKLIGMANVWSKNSIPLSQKKK